MDQDITETEAIPRKVLVIEDDCDLSDALKRSIQDLAPIFEATTLEQAKTLLKVHSFQLVVSDVNLPDGDAIHFFQDNLKNPSFEQPQKILFLSADHDIERQIQGIAVGHCDYLVKPSSPRLIRAKIRINLGLDA